MDGVTTAGEVTSTTASVTTARTQAAQARSSSPQPPPISALMAQPSATVLQEIEKTKADLRQFPSTVDLTKLCDHALLNMSGSIHTLIDRYWWYEIRCRFRGVRVVTPSRTSVGWPCRIPSYPCYKHRRLTRP